jgi:hypothetical protein
MVIKYTNIFNSEPSKICPNLDFWFENKPSGNPDETKLIWLKEMVDVWCRFKLFISRAKIWKVEMNLESFRPMLYFLKYFRQKNCPPKLASLNQNTAKSSKNWIIALVFKFFAENRQKTA